MLSHENQKQTVENATDSFLKRKGGAFYEEKLGKTSRVLFEEDIE